MTSVGEIFQPDIINCFLRDNLPTHAQKSSGPNTIPDLDSFGLMIQFVRLSSHLKRATVKLVKCVIGMG